MRRVILAILLAPAIAFAESDPAATPDATPTPAHGAPVAAPPAILAPAPALVEVVRGEPVNVLLAPRELAPEDFVVEWADPSAAIPEVELGLEPGSLQWVRVQEVMRLPRARLRVRAPGIGAGQVTSAGFTQPLAPSRDNDGAGVAEVLVALVSGSANPIRVVVERQGERLEAEARLRYVPRPRASRSPRVFVDTTCSAFGVKVLPEAGAIDDRWAYVGCKMDAARSQGSLTSSLEIFVFWDSVGEVIDVDGVETRSSGASIWRLRASYRPGAIVLRARGQERGMKVHYAIPERPHKGSLGVGVGPYVDLYDVNGNEKFFVEPLVTFYGSYQVSPSSRLVAFNATPLRKESYTDTGFYLVRRTSETLDRRVTFNVFLGAHLLFYETDGRIRSDFSAPQGLEVLFRDAGEPGYNFLLGALINPGIGDRSYYNAWLRWGNAKAFVELNYLGWSQTYVVQGLEREVTLRSFGVSVGFPLIRFL